MLLGGTILRYSRLRVHLYNRESCQQQVKMEINKIYTQSDICEERFCRKEPDKATETVKHTKSVTGILS
jgi:hypothetical protein